MIHMVCLTRNQKTRPINNCLNTQYYYTPHSNTEIPQQWLWLNPIKIMILTILTVLLLGPVSQTHARSPTSSPSDHLRAIYPTIPTTTWVEKPQTRRWCTSSDASLYYKTRACLVAFFWAAFLKAQGPAAFYMRGLSPSDGLRFSTFFPRFFWMVLGRVFKKHSLRTYSDQSNFLKISLRFLFILFSSDRFWAL